MEPAWFNCAMALQPCVHASQAAEFQKRLLMNETRFILAVVSGDLVVSNRRRADIIADLEAACYDKMPPNKKARAWT